MADTITSDFAVNRVYKHSGEITTTIKTSLLVSSLGTSAVDLGPDLNGDIIIGFATASKVMLLSGQFTTTIKTSAAMLALAYAIAYDTGDNVAEFSAANKARLRSGIFTATIKTSLTLTGVTIQPLGGDTSENDYLIASYAGASNPDSVWASGRFTTTIKSSVSLPATANTWNANATSGGDTLAGHRSPSQRYYLFSGQVTSTIKSSITPANTFPAGSATTDVQTRLNLSSGGGSVGMFGLIFDNDLV